MDRKIKHVQVDGLVLLKIIKHCQDEMAGGSTEVVQGILLGLSRDDTVEVTHSFPLPRTPEDDSTTNSYLELLSAYETDMIRNLRQVNVDYMNVGFYQSCCSGSYFNRPAIESLHQHQMNMEESIMLVYDPTKSSRGQVSLKAYQISNSLNKIMTDAQQQEAEAGNKVVAEDFEPDAYRNMKMDMNDVCVDVPVSVRNSHLMNVLLCDLEETLPKGERSFASLDLGTGAMMEKESKQLMTGLEDLSHNVVSHLQYQKNLNRTNKESGRNINLLPRLDACILSAQVSQVSKDITELSGQTMGKLMLTKGVHKLFTDSV